MKTRLVLQSKEVRIQETKDQISWTRGTGRKTGNGLG